MDHNNWTFWQRSLAGEKPEVEPGNPQTGYYRLSNEAIAIWREGDGSLHCQRSRFRGRMDAEAIDELFGRVCRSPIKHEVFANVMQGGAWPEDIERPAERGIGDNSASLKPHQRIMAEIIDLRDAARSWFKSIGGKIAHQEHADKAANYADAFAALEKKAADTHEELKRPILEEGRRIDKEWKPVAAEASDAKREFKGVLVAFLSEKKKQQQEEEAKAREEAAAKGEIPQHRPQGTTAGTRGRVSLRSVKVVEITDMKAVAQFYLSMETLPRELEETLKKLATRAVEGGAQVPGTNLKIEQRAA